MEWFVAGLVGFFVGMAVERFIIDRKFIHQMTQLGMEMAKLRAQRDKDYPV